MTWLSPINLAQAIADIEICKKIYLDKMSVPGYEPDEFDLMVLDKIVEREQTYLTETRRAVEQSGSSLGS